MTAVSPAGAPAAEVGRGVPRATRWRLGRLPAVGLWPFAAYFIVFLAVPTVGVLVGAFQSPKGGATFDNINKALSNPYLTGYWTTIKLAFWSSVIPGILGFFIAYAVHVSGEGNWLRRTVATASGVFANFGGVFLAFLFTSTFGAEGLASGWLRQIGLTIAPEFLYHPNGIALVYGYFQIPLMVLVITPALGALRPASREAAENLGSSTWSYWRLVGLPVLLPSALGAVLLLFGSAMSAYATADALTSGSVPITSIQISSFVNGNVIPGEENVGKAISLVLLVIVAIVMATYVVVQRRASRWLR